MAFSLNVEHLERGARPISRLAKPVGRLGRSLVLLVFCLVVIVIADQALSESRYSAFLISDAEAGRAPLFLVTLRPTVEP